MRFSEPDQTRTNPSALSGSTGSLAGLLTWIESKPSSPMALSEFERAIADLRPEDLDGPETLRRIAAVPRLGRPARERLALLAMETFCRHEADEGWTPVMKKIVSDAAGRSLFRRRDPVFVGLYAKTIETFARRHGEEAEKRAKEALPFASERDAGFIWAVFETISNKAAVRQALARQWVSVGDYLRSLWAVGRFMNAAVLLGFLSWMMPATASAGYDRQPTATVGREAPATPSRQPAAAAKPAKGESAPGISAPARSVTWKSAPGPIKVGPEGVSLRWGKDGINVDVRANSGVSIPSADPKAAQQKTNLSSAAPNVSAKVSGIDWLAKLDVTAKLQKQGADEKVVLGAVAVVAVLDEMREAGIAFRVSGDTEHGFKDAAAKLGITVGEDGVFYITAGVIQRVVEEISKFKNIGDPTIHTTLRNFFASAEYRHDIATDPTKILQQLFVIAKVMHQPRTNAGKPGDNGIIGQYVIEKADEYEQGRVKAVYAWAWKVVLEAGMKLYINPWLEMQLRAGMSLTAIEGLLGQKMKMLFSPSGGVDFKIRILSDTSLVIESSAERSGASIETRVEYSPISGLQIGPAIRADASKGSKPTFAVMAQTRLKIGGTPANSLEWLFGTQWTAPYLTMETENAQPIPTKPRHGIDKEVLAKFDAAFDAAGLPINPKETFREMRIADLHVPKGVFASIDRNPDGTINSVVYALARPIKAIVLPTDPAILEYFAVDGGKLRIFTQNKAKRYIPPGEYRLGFVETDDQLSGMSYMVDPGSSKLTAKVDQVNDIPAEFFSLLESYVSGAIKSMTDFKEQLQTATGVPEVSALWYSEITTNSAKVSIAAKGAAKGTAHTVIIRGRKLSDAEIKALTLEVVKSGTLGEYRAVALDEKGAATMDVTSDTDGIDITVATIVEGVNKQISKTAKGATTTLPALAWFAAAPVFAPTPNTMSGTVTATVTKTDATVYVAYFDAPLSNLSDVAKVRDATGAVASVNFRTANKTGSGALTFSKPGKAYGYAVTVNENGISKAATALGEYVAVAPTDAPKLSSVACDADAETCSVQTDMAGAKVKIAVSGTNVTFEGVADKDGKFSIDYAGKLAAGNYEFVFTLTHPANDKISGTAQKSVTISPNPAPTLVGELAISAVGTASYVISGAASEAGDSYVLALPKVGLTAGSVTVERVIAEGKKTALVKDNTGKWAFSATMDGRAADTEYVNFVVFVDAKNKPSANSYQKETKTNANAPTNQAPTHALSVSSKTYNSVTFALSAADDGGVPTVYYVGVPTGSSKPTELQIREWKDANGTVVSIKGTLSGATPTVSGLEASKTYKFFSVAWDGEKYSAIDEDEFTTDAAPVTNQAPALTSLVASGVTATAASLTCNGSDADNDATTCYAVVLASGSPAPSAAQIMAGQDASGNPALKSGSTTSGAVAITGLSDGTALVAYSVLRENSTADHKFSEVRSTTFATLPTLATSVTSKTHNAATLGVIATTGSTVHYSVVALGATTPTAAQIKAGQDASGTPVSLHGTLSGATPTVSGFSPSTGYKIATVAEKNGVLGEVDADEFTTDAAPVTNQAPTLTSVVASGVTATAASLTCNGSDADNDATTCYAVVLPSGAPEPTPAQIMAGQDSSGAAAVKSGSSASGPISITGLSASTAYKTYAVSRENSGEQKFSSVRSTTFTTLFTAVADAPSSMDLAGSSTLLINSTTPTITAAAPANATAAQARVETVGGTLVSDWSTAGVDLSGGTISFTPASALAESAGVANDKYVFKFRGIDGNGTPGPASTLSGVDIRTTGAGTMNNWGDNIAPLYQGVESQKSFLPSAGFGGSVSELSCVSVPAAADSSELSCSYNSATGAVDVTFKTKLQPSYRLTISGKDAYGVSFTKTQIVSNLTVPTPAAAPANATLTTATDANADGKISDTTPDLSASLPSGATHLEYRVDGGSWVVVADNTTTFTTAALAVGDHTVEIAGANSYGRGPASSVALSIRTSGPGTLPTWGDTGTQPTKQSTEYTRVFTAPSGFGGSVSDLSCTAPLGGTVSSCSYGQTLDPGDGHVTSEYITVTFTTAPQPGFRLVVAGKDAFGVSFSKTQNASGLTL